MKRLIILILISFTIGLSQSQINTQDASNRYKNYSAATTGDTLVKKATAVANSTVSYASAYGYLVGILVGTPVSKDTLTVKNGVGTVLSVILDSVYTTSQTGGVVRYTTPIYIPVNARTDTSLIYIQKKTSNVTLIFRANAIR